MHKAQAKDGVSFTQRLGLFELEKALQRCLSMLPRKLLEWLESQWFAKLEFLGLKMVINCVLGKGLAALNNMRKCTLYMLWYLFIIMCCKSKP